MDTLEQFEERFGTETQCLEYLTFLRWPEGYRCPRCQFSEAWKLNDRKYKCKRCGYQATTTARTLFQDSHIPLMVWMKAAWYLTQPGGKKKASDLQKLLGLGSNRTALLMMEKLALVWEGCVSHKLEGVVEIRTRRIKISNKKGNPPVLFIAAVELQGMKAGRMQMGIIHDKYYHSENEFVKQNIVPGSKLVGAGWNGNRELKEYELTGKKRSFSFKHANKALEDLSRSIDTIRRQRSTIPRYIREYCFRKNCFQGEVSFETLLKTALEFAPAPYGKLPARSKKSIEKAG